MPGIPGNHESREGKPHGPTKQGNPGEIPVGSDLCPLPRKTNATGQGKEAGVPGSGLGLGDGSEVGGEVGQGRGAEGQLLSWVPFYPPGHCKALRRSC